MTLRRDDRAIFGTASVVFSGLALIISLAALITAGQAWSRSNDTKAKVAELQANGVSADHLKVRLQEYQVFVAPPVARAGTVRIEATNVGTTIHEMVLVRADSYESLPRVAVATADRAAGDVDEEAIPEQDKAGEMGDVAPGKTVSKNFELTPGNYVMFCNIDNPQPDGTVINHFQRGMHASFAVQ